MRFCLPLLLLLVLVLVLALSPVASQELTPAPYAIGDREYLEYYVSTSGNDENSGRSPSAPLRTLTAAYQKIPRAEELAEAIRINLAPGTYEEASLPNFWEEIFGTSEHPVIIRAADGVGSVTLLGDINALRLRYVYFLDLDIIPDPAGDTFHCEQCDHILLRGITLDGGSRSSGAQETLKINQSQYIYIEDSKISGATDNAIDYVGVQYGHIIRSEISEAHDWCVYVKGGSAQITLAGSTIHDCGTGGFTAGQGTGFEFMVSPWLHYEAYDIKFIQNIVYDTEGAGMGVNGALNTLLAFNTLYRNGSRSHILEVYRGRRGCDGTTAQCAQHEALGGWGGTGSEEQVIPNRNVYIYNNLFVNPAGFSSGGQFIAVHEPQAELPGFPNIPFPAEADDNLQIRGNIFSSAPSDQPIGIEDTAACTDSNPTCSLSQLSQENSFNEVSVSFRNPNDGDFRPENPALLQATTGFEIPSFPSEDLGLSPVYPEGNLENSIDVDRGGQGRTGSPVPGAYTSASSDLGEAGPGNDGGGGANSNPPVIEEIIARKKRLKGTPRRTEIRLAVEATDPDGDLQSVQANVSIPNSNRLKMKKLKRRSGVFRGKLKVKRSASYLLTITARDDEGNTSTTSEDL